MLARLDALQHTQAGIALFFMPQWHSRAELAGQQQQQQAGTLQASQPTTHAKQQSSTVCLPATACTSRTHQIEFLLLGFLIPDY